MGGVEIFTMYRDSYNEDNTLGVMLRNGSMFGYTLEDTVRCSNYKLPGKTAIEFGVYELEVKMSNKYNEERVFIKNVPHFTGVQIHGGNDEDDTEGCVLCGINRDCESQKIWGSLKDEIVQIVKASKKAYLHIHNLNQYRG